MRKITQLNQQDFDNLLGWFSSDVDEAGKIYEKVRAGLIKYFNYRGCQDSELLADETITRVAVKLSSFTFNEEFKIITYFYSFAANIYREEYARRKRYESKINEIKKLYEQEDAIEEEINPATVCLQKCLAKHSPDERDFLLKYYSFEKNEKKEQRKKMAEVQNFNMSQMHTRISRLKKSLRECVKNCLGEKKI